MTCSSFFEANLKPILFINIISTCCYVWYLTELFKLPFYFSLFTIKTIWNYWFQMWYTIGEILPNCSTYAVHLCGASSKTSYKISVEFTFIKCEFLWTNRTYCVVFLILFYASLVIKPSEEQDIIEDKIKYYKFKQGWMAVRNKGTTCLLVLLVPKLVFQTEQVQWNIYIDWYVYLWGIQKAKYAGNKQRNMQ
jgi:hypothetical protein